jgi:hypothetical protein
MAFEITIFSERDIWVGKVDAILIGYDGRTKITEEYKGNLDLKVDYGKVLVHYENNNEPEVDTFNIFNVEIDKMGDYFSIYAIDCDSDIDFQDPMSIEDINELLACATDY